MFKYSRKILRIAIPVMIENLLQSITGLVDSYLIAQLGLVAVSGVAIANNVLAIYQALFIALGAAVSSVLARNLKSEGSITYQKQAFLLCLLLSFVLGSLTIVGSWLILPNINLDSSVSKAASQYLIWVGGGIVSLGLLTILGAMLRAKGKVNSPMYVSLLVNLLNALLSALAVYVLEVGITGVAVATVLSRLLGILILGFQLPELFTKSDWSLWGDKELIKNSLPATLERFMMRGGDVVVLSLVITLGTVTVAGHSIGETITQFNYLPGVSMATAVIIISSGISLEERLLFLREAYILTVLLMIGVSGGVLLSFPNIISYFTENSRVAEIARLVALFSLLGTPSTAGTLIFTAVWQSLGKAEEPFYATTIGMWVVRVVIGYLITITLGVGYEGIWIATILDNVFRWTYLVVNYYKKVG